MRRKLVTTLDLGSDYSLVTTLDLGSLKTYKTHVYMLVAEFFCVTFVLVLFLG